ncbi:protein SCAR2-like [Hordeum vulgare subsp. vulgare]|uniref:Protein SCAR n=1 Tax=Hordeum vulgare subsp. vulgare TaxID=112509 RepID=M0XA45_HORVV|nr:protein SCAR2-like [Hordeum vulgare subsp. vulgare]
MPLSRHTVANEYSLGGRDLYKRADQHDPEAVLDGVATAGLVGLLRQLGDLAEFAAEVFHGLYDEVMTASARGHGLVLRVQQLEAELPLLEKDVCQRDYLYVASNRGVDWHANLRVDHGVVTTGDTPRFIMDSIKQCHGPPRLFMLDKYDIGGEGTCMKRYSDPAFFKTDSACSRMLQEGMRTERRPIRTMEIRPNLQNAEIFGPSDGANNGSRFKTDLSDEVLDEVPTRRQRLKHRQLNGTVFRSFRPQMQDLYEKSSPEEKTVSMDRSEVQISFTVSLDTNAEERDIMMDTSSSTGKSKEGYYATTRKRRSTSQETPSSCSDDRSAGSSKGYNSEVDIYVDALTTMGSEVGTDSEHRDHGGQGVFALAPSGKMCSDAQGAAVSRSSTFSKKEDSCSSDVASANRDEADHSEEDASVCVPEAKLVGGEHERTSSLEELFSQEKPVSCEHERTVSLEELLTGDMLLSESDTRELVTESNGNAIVSNATSDGTADATKRSKGNNVSAISFKKTASKRCVESMELFASKVGILPRKLSKKHDPFSDSLRNMAKQLLELKCDGTQDTDLYEFEVNGDGFNVECRKMAHPRVEIMEESFRKSISFDSPQDDVGSRECQLEVVDQESDHDVPTADSPQDSVPDENGFQHTDVYLTVITSPSPKEEEEEEEEGWAVVAPDEHSSAGIVDHASELIQEQTEDIHTEVFSENASDMSEDLKEIRICDEHVYAEDADGCSESEEYASDEEIAEKTGEHVAPDDVISSRISSKQSDDPCQVTPFTLTDADFAVASEGPENYIPEMEHVTLLETVVETGLPKGLTESVISSEAAGPDNEQCCLHPETSLPQDTVLGSCELLDQNEQLQLHSSSMMSAIPDPAVNTGEIHELHEEPPNPCNGISTEIFADQLAPDSRDLPLPSISSFDWMLNGLMNKSLNVVPAPSSNIIDNGSSEDTEEAPPLPPLPPMQWRATKLQTGSISLFAKSGRPPRPKPPVKHQENDNNFALVETNQESENAQEISRNNGFTSQKETAQARVCSETPKDLLPESDSQENNLQEGYRECDVQSSNLFFSSEVKCNTDVTSVGDDAHTMKPPELIVIPEEAWSELVDIKPILKQEEERKQQLINRVSNCSSIHASGLPTEKTTVDHERSDQKEELSAADSNTITDSEENKPNGLPCQDNIQSPDFSVQQEDSSNDMVKEFSSALEEELAKLPPHSVPEPPKYPLLQVISHDRSMLRKAPTLVQPSSKLSDEKNTVLDEIKNKTFNLKPVVAKRPNVMGGPRTNLQVAAILERANAIRQAVADDDDEDSWSE